MTNAQKLKTLKKMIENPKCSDFRKSEALKTIKKIIEKHLTNG